MNSVVRQSIALYQKILSPDKNIFIKRTPSCRFFPSCSEYGLEAFQRFGFFKAFFYTTRRVFRCHPFSKGGHDPLP
ncbi:MAG: membrane protein insertion efficiency factor YidD [Candidatus Niyogibacteria bacterium CG10_big_fil_rev_8_21_14_0_10_46_36]|uniref:Putative membrane protein insertion efficiency factor n=1 Tax=Candidatus Niyogibacteria bacterium CG10_big_fil_rev_8_21_14_0_10_46_36 TaxID=1974726 RepID=A0A2H0TDH0_9BACT|nr:MAG: membrane protein insertion efficiency factor YidD [Candidatus Niyogibacteria bacterium CG10_big_fil_rev_8_21_14_0_10_46_36]